MSDNPFLWFLIYLILGLAVVWLIGAFITWNLLWFISSVVGRIFGILFFISVLGGAIEESSKM
jgi:hypothetical protein